MEEFGLDHDVVSPGTTTDRDAVAGDAPSELGSYLAGWGVAGACSLLLTGILAGPPRLSTLLLVLTAITFFADVVEIELSTARTSSAFTLAEAAIAVNLSLLGPGEAFAATLIGVAAAQGVRTRDLRKWLFNVSQLATAAGAAVAIRFLLLGDTSSLVAVPDLTAIGVLAVAMAGYTIVNLAAMSGLIARRGPRRQTEIARVIGPQLSATVFGTVAVGALGVSVWVSDPALVVLLIAPIAAVYLSSRGSVRSQQLLAEIREEHERLRHVISGASDGIILVDENGHVEVWNEAMQHLTDRAAEDASGRPLAEVLPIELAVPAGTPDPRPGATVEEATLDLPGGTRKVVSVSRAALQDSDGEPTGAVVVVHDITRQREIAELKQHFVARVSHELRTPLTPIRGFAQALLDGDEQVAPDRRRRALQQIVERATHMSRLVEDLLLVTQQGDEPPADESIDLEPVDVGLLMERAATWARENEPTRDVHVRVPAQGCVAKGDELRLFQVVTNLVTNALKYSPAGEPIELEATRGPDGTVELAVADRGSGIPPGQRETIFEAFQRLEDPLTMRTGGVGLGLFLARRFTRAMGGELTVADRPGGGSVFTVSLPAAPTAT